MAEVQLDEREVEDFVAGRDRCVQGERGIGPDLCLGFFERGTGGDRLLQSFQNRQCGVALIDVPDRRFHPQRLQGLHRSDAQHHLLAEPHFASAYIERVGDRPVGRVVVRDVRVEQQQRDHSDLQQPDGGVYGPTGEVDRNLQLPSGRAGDGTNR